jgi:hypothetical protein
MLEEVLFLHISFYINGNGNPIFKEAFQRIYCQTFCKATSEKEILFQEDQLHIVKEEWGYKKLN